MNGGAKQTCLGLLLTLSEVKQEMAVAESRPCG